MESGAHFRYISGWNSGNSSCLGQEKNRAGLLQGRWVCWECEYVSFSVRYYVIYVHAPPCWFASSVHPGLPRSIPFAFPHNIPLICCKVGVVSVLAFIARSTAVANTDLVTVRPTISYGVPGCACGFTVVGATTSPSTSASPRGEVGDDGKELGDLSVTCREGGR